MNRRTILAGALALGAGPARGAGPGAAEGFRFVAAPGAPFSTATAAGPGRRFVRLRFARPLPLSAGLERLAALVRAEGLTPAALAAVELRSPRQLSRADFAAFNRTYVAALAAAGFPTGEPMTPARSNMAPAFDAPTSAVLHAATLCAPAAGGGGRDWVISGKPENRPDGSTFAAGETGEAALARKAAFVAEGLGAVAAALGVRLADASAAQVYARSLPAAVLPALAAAGLGAGLTLVPGDPPSVGADGAPFVFEVDARRVSEERLVGD